MQLIFRHTAYSSSKKEPKIKDKLKPEAALKQLSSLKLKVKQDATQIEDILGDCCTPVQGDGYFRVLIRDDSLAAEIINEGIPGLELLTEEPTWTETDEDGAERQCYLGQIV